ncbi:hypothetical protein ABW19_dt0200818 [Dactylella cylindrospora]|nr:hypothetical protein ABW19_dt0200818 [Dactylella cylindrospora]
MCLVKVKGEVEDDVIVPARVVERDTVNRETQIVETAPAVVERIPRPSRSRRYSSSSSSSSSRSSGSYRGRHHRGSYRESIQDSGSSARSRSRDGYYREHERVVSGGSYDRGNRGHYRYVDPEPRGSSHEVRREVMRAEEHLRRAHELEERERRVRVPRAIAYDPRSSSASHRSYEHSRDGSRRSTRDIVVIQQDDRRR